MIKLINLLNKEWLRNPVRIGYFFLAIIFVLGFSQLFSIGIAGHIGISSLILINSFIWYGNNVQKYNQNTFSEKLELIDISKSKLNLILYLHVLVITYFQIMILLAIIELFRLIPNFYDLVYIDQDFKVFQSFGQFLWASFWYINMCMLVAYVFANYVFKTKFIYMSFVIFIFVLTLTVGDFFIKNCGFHFIDDFAGGKVLDRAGYHFKSYQNFGISKLFAWINPIYWANQSLLNTTIGVSASFEIETVNYGLIVGDHYNIFTIGQYNPLTYANVSGLETYQVLFAYLPMTLSLAMISSLGINNFDFKRGWKKWQEKQG